MGFCLKNKFYLISLWQTSSVNLASALSKHSLEGGGENPRLQKLESKCIFLDWGVMLSSG